MLANITYPFVSEINVTITLLSVTLALITVLCVFPLLQQSQRILSAKPIESNNSFNTLKLLSDRAVQGFQNNSTAYSISQLLAAYDVLPRLANNDGAGNIPGGIDGVSFLLGDTIKLLTVNTNSAVRNITISYLNTLEEQVTHLLAFEGTYSNKSDAQGPSKETLLAYVNKPYGIRISYPLTWIIKIDANYSLPSNLTYLHPRVISSFYLPNATDGLPFLYVGTNSDLSKQFKQLHFTIEQYLNKSIQSKENSHSFPDFKLIQRSGPDQSNSTLGGFPAYKIIWTYKHPQYGLREIIEYGTVLNGTKGYFMDYAASASKFSKYLPVADRMKSSFAIIKDNHQYEHPTVNQTRSLTKNVVDLTFDCHALRL